MGNSVFVFFLLYHSQIYHYVLSLKSSKYVSDSERIKHARKQSERFGTDRNSMPACVRGLAVTVLCGINS